MKKVIALLLAVMMIAALCACGSTTETTETTEAATPEPVAAETATEAPAEAAAPAAGDLEAYKAYVSAYAEAGAPTDDEKAAAVAAIAACTTAAEVEECQYLTPMFSGEMILTYDAWVEAGCPAADTSNMATGDPNAGAASGEPSEEPAA